ncbi:hypothetical protein [Microbacterium sp. 69-10]|uniref:hypothetical protein n=1 Tax=Microbacterium sp. 69-10 TaxID=1895783 RepID=UPI0025E2A55E|nr:hypothetical protein [Microbacterium sp. 69-10]
MQHELKLLKVSLERTTRELEAVGRDNSAYRAREAARFRSDRAAEQRKRQEAEREDKAKRRQELSDGMLRLADASEWAIVSDERGKVLELTVPLSGDVEPIVHGVLSKKAEPSAAFGAGLVMDEWQRRVADSVNAMAANARRIRYAYGI